MRPESREERVAISQMLGCHLRVSTSVLLLTNLCFMSSLSSKADSPICRRLCSLSFQHCAPPSGILEGGPRNTVPHPPHLCYRTAWCHRAPTPPSGWGAQDPHHWLSGCTQCLPQDFSNLVAGSPCCGLKVDPACPVSALWSAFPFVCCSSPSTALPTPKSQGSSSLSR